MTLQQSTKGSKRKPIIQKYRLLPDGAVRAVEGQEARTLRALVNAGSRGVTAQELSSWALRVAHYCMKLRKHHGLAIETVRETHTGLVPGWHGRYVLHSAVQLIEAEASHV